ncbi:MAG: class I adenylate-forming enzyme family protein [Myxococcota bacterium]
MSAHHRLLRAEEFGDRPCLHFGQRTLSYSQIYTLAAVYADELNARGIRSGDRVAVLSDSSPDLVVALFAHHRAGVVHVPINTRYQVAEVKHIFTDFRPSFVLVDDAHADIVAEAAPELPVRMVSIEASYLSFFKIFAARL